MEEALVSTLKLVGKHFTKNELAYLSLTSKIELPIRDQWAFLLHSELSKNGLIVSREWKRIDLAILKNGIPLAFVELKAMYSFNAALDPKGISGFIDAMSKDEKKATILAGGTTEIFTVLLATHPCSIIDSSFSWIIKYRSDINQAIGNVSVGGSSSLVTDVDEVRTYESGRVIIDTHNK